MSEVAQKEIRLSKQLSILILVALIPASSMSFNAEQVSMVLGSFFLSLVLLATLFFNLLRLTTLARIVLASLPNLAILIPLAVYKDVSLEAIQVLGFVSVSLGIIPLVLFNVRLEKSYFAATIATNVLTVGAFDFVLRDILANSQSAEAIALLGSRIPQVYFLLVIVGVFVFYQKRYNSSETQLLKKNADLLRKNEELSMRNDQLRNSESNIQEQKTLIESQTRAIRERNKTLAEHSHIMLQLAKSDFVQKGIISGALEEIARTISLTLGLSRVSIWKLDGNRMECQKLYSRISNSIYEGYIFDLTEFSDFKSRLAEGEILKSLHSAEDKDLKAFYDKGLFDSEIKSTLFCPYMVDGALRGLILCEQSEVTKKWSPEDLNMVKVASDILTISFSSNRLRSETEIIRKQHEEILQKNQFIESQKEQILYKNESLERSRRDLQKSLSDLKKTEEALALKEAESRGVLDGINDHNLVVKYNLQGEIVWMNERTMELTGISKKDLEGAYRYSIKSLLLRSNHFNHHEYDAFWSSLSRGVSRKYELRLSLPGHELWVAATFLPIKDNEGNVDSILAVAHDISTVKSQQLYIEEQNNKLKEQRKEIVRMNNTLENRVKERTEQLEKQNRQLTEYAFINAHLLRAPVCNILGLVDLLLKYDLSGDQVEIVDYLHTSTKELDEMVMKINRSIKKGYYDDPEISAQVENWMRKKRKVSA